MNDEINLEGIDLTPCQEEMCKGLLYEARVEPFVSKEIYTRLLATIQIAMKLGIKSEIDMFEQDLDID